MSQVDQWQERGAELPVIRICPRDCGTTFERWGLMDVLGEGHDEDGHFVVVCLSVTLGAARFW